MKILLDAPAEYIPASDDVEVARLDDLVVFWSASSDFLRMVDEDCGIIFPGTCRKNIRDFAHAVKVGKAMIS